MVADDFQFNSGNNFEGQLQMKDTKKRIVIQCREKSNPHRQDNYDRTHKLKVI